VASDRERNFEFLIVLWIMKKKQLNWRRPRQGVILMSLKLGGLHEKHAVATWNFGTISAFARRQRKTKKEARLNVI
jgi:hypothetical protein